jgi:hypothetical protein
MDMTLSITVEPGLTLCQQFLGQSYEYLKRKARRLSIEEEDNVSRIFARAIAKLGISQLELAEYVPLRTLAAVVGEARTNNDAVLDEYLAGVLCKCRSPFGVDDSGTAIVATIRSLPIYSIRLHFTIYRAVYDLSQGSPVPDQMTSYKFRRQELLKEVYSRAFDGTGRPSDRLIKIADHDLGILHSIGLIIALPDVSTSPELRIKPSLAGAELFEVARTGEVSAGAWTSKDSIQRDLPRARCAVV